MDEQEARGQQRAAARYENALTLGLGPAQRTDLLRELGRSAPVLPLRAMTPSLRKHRTDTTMRNEHG